MNRRSFLRSLRDGMGAGIAAIAAPAVFVPKLIEPAWGRGEVWPKSNATGRLTAFLHELDSRKVRWPETFDRPTRVRRISTDEWADGLRRHFALLDEQRRVDLTAPMEMSFPDDGRGSMIIRTTIDPNATFAIVDGAGQRKAT